ncbi:hypothetical protein [Streptomyces radicis]|uniref:hypothetical protein n=1 Tax=Streptomyces radicis TaxID=1750517 RepID=UPI002E361B6D|nr:hypothetical protein [Streptomyces radicis]
MIWSNGGLGVRSSATSMLYRLSGRAAVLVRYLQGQGSVRLADLLFDDGTQVGIVGLSVVAESSVDSRVDAYAVGRVSVVTAVMKWSQDAVENESSAAFLVFESRTGTT